MALVSIDPKALEHACLCAGRSVHHFERMGDDLPLRASIVAHARAIERLESTEARHAAELREQAERFSEAAQAAMQCGLKLSAAAHLSPFILAPVDPLGGAMSEAMCGIPGEDYTQPAADLRAALEARGLAIVKKEAVNG